RAEGGIVAEVERGHEEILPVLLLRDLAGGVVVEILEAARQAERVRIGPAIAGAQRRDVVLVSVLLGQLLEQGAVERPRVHVLEGLAVALVPVADEVAEQHATPAHAALQEREPELGEAPGDPAEEDSLA